MTDEEFSTEIRRFERKLIRIDPEIRYSIIYTVENNLPLNVKNFER